MTAHDRTAPIVTVVAGRSRKLVATDAAANRTEVTRSIKLRR